MIDDVEKSIWYCRHDLQDFQERFNEIPKRQLYYPCIYEDNYSRFISKF